VHSSVSLVGDAAVSAPRPPAPPSPLLRVSQLSKSFGAVRAVDGVGFEIRAGEIYGLLGPNGAGKTTTISIISGLVRADAGEVFVDERPFWSDPQAAKALMGVVPQDIALYQELTAYENLMYWSRLAGLDSRRARTRADELLDALALRDRAKSRLKTFSGGMKRRINLACALMHRPRLLLLDEPTVGIDPQARLKILEFIRDLRAAGSAILYTTHYLEEAETLCDRIGIIDHGRLLAEGTLAQLQERLGATRIFVLDGAWTGAQPETWPRFHAHFRVVQHTDRQLVAAALDSRDPAECLRDLLALPVRTENVTLKRPSLNDMFLQLTGRELRE
jgi:ABC-2 type transport system ATP-binding protein